MRYRVFASPERPIGERLRRLLALPGFPGEPVAFGAIDLACTDDPATAAELHRDFVGKLPVWLDLDAAPRAGLRAGFKPAPTRGIARADLVTVPTRGLLDEVRRIAPRVELLPDPVEPPPPATEDDPPLIGPAVGYVGPTDEFWDADVPVIIAEQDRRLQVHLGASAAKIEPLAAAERRLPNLHFLPDDRAVWRRRFLVGIFPYRVDDRTRRWLPAPLLETWAAGIPAVCAPLPEVAHLGSFAPTAASPAEWAHQAQRLAAEPETAAQIAREAAAFVAREHSPAAVLARLRECLYALSDQLLK
jgi:glycosyltransferase involved in cell wall biosynthesis